MLASSPDSVSLGEEWLVRAPGSGTAVSANRYASALATVLRGSALPYGYTVTVWTSGMMLVRHRGLPTTGQVFLFMLGAVVAFALLGAVVQIARGVALEPARGALRHAGMLDVFAVGGALGAATLVALVPSGAACRLVPLGPLRPTSGWPRWSSCSSA
jgi:hypothetical protein